MKTTEKVLSVLEQNKDDFVSGEDIAALHDISRNAVWKAVNELRNRGYAIEAVSNKGYRLSRNSDIVSVEGIRACLPADLKDIADKTQVFDTIGSTSDLAKELAVKGADHGTCVISLSQSGGRGRKDHSFFSPSGGLYMSMILKPQYIPYGRSDLITGFIGLCVCKAILELTGQQPVIKGINDLYINDRKICGILIESGSEFDSDTLQWIVAGIGINFDSDINDFPNDIKDVAASLFRPGKATVSKNELAARIIGNVFSGNCPGEDELIKELRDCRKE